MSDNWIEDALVAYLEEHGCNGLRWVSGTEEVCTCRIEDLVPCGDVCPSNCRPVILEGEPSKEKILPDGFCHCVGYVCGGHSYSGPCFRPKLCAAKVADNLLHRYHQCSRKSGYGKGGIYCRQHALQAASSETVLLE